jgi:hypothetical protein
LHTNDLSVQPFWDALEDDGAELILTAHEHNYERFAPMDPAGMKNGPRGIRQFVVGTGGANLRSFGAIHPNSQARASVHGVLKLTLTDRTYRWDFISVAGSSYTDSGVKECH